VTRLTPISTEVNNVRNKGPDLITPASPGQLVTAPDGDPAG
jgi:hypothetical protein